MFLRWLGSAAESQYREVLGGLSSRLIPGLDCFAVPVLSVVGSIPARCVSPGCSSGLVLVDAALFAAQALPGVADCGACAVSPGLPNQQVITW